MSRRFSSLKLGSALIALAAATPLCAQDVPPPAGDALSNSDEGEIVVTARRRAESLLDVPIALSVYSGEQLEAQGALDITDIADTTPNVTLEASRGTNSTLTAFIRGVGQQDPVAGFEAGVGIYVDDVYLNRPQAALLDIYNVERIEILRGPQGTLYGRNTIGGAIKYVTRRMPRDPELRVRATVGTYDQADLVLTGSTPVGDGLLRIGGSAARLSRGGFGDNLTTGLENYNRDIWAGRLAVEVNNDDNLFVRIQGDLTQDNSEPRGGHRLIPGLVSGTPVLEDVYDSRGGLLDPEQDVRAWGVSLFAEVQPADGWTLRSITAYRRDRSNTPIDFDALPAVDVDVPAVYRNSQTSQELQVLYNRGPFNGLIGFYYLDANAETIFDVRLPGGVTALTFGDVETQTSAIFGDFTYDLSPQFSVSVGGRYTWDKRTSDILRQTFLGGGSPFFGGGGMLFATTSDFTGTADFEEFTPRASVSFKPAENQTIYASYSRGFKGGGFDPRGQTSACRNATGGLCTPQEIFDFISFDPETVTSYELGYRASLWDRRVNFSLALFHADYRDVQVPGSIGTTVGGQQTFIGVTTNAGKARFRGVEFEGNAIVARDFGSEGDSLNFSWSLGYLDAEYREFIDARGIDVADRRAIQNTPEWTASGTLNYGVPVGPGLLNFITTLSYRSASQQFELRTPGLDQPGYALWDASLVWRSDDDRWSIGLHGRNLTDKRYIVSGYNFLNQDPDTGAFEGNGVGAGLPANVPGFDPTLGAEGVLTAYYGNPRQVYLSIGMNF
ncbi:TonB-dependent receptor [Sphingosinicella sp. LHD-64]|uniref:TonB-dependent receptor n=1 Tax=Sphingosinicella sp. LHD-64 TaxID=3072139 RepID=UPI0028101449|nr:TonB-dependent receptor [Sphingosinicella sp. LHD-64]MDQ8756781.1 TonB-dependent receptor [Sphingosinicella sp. LHD-64]